MRLLESSLALVLIASPRAHPLRAQSSASGIAAGVGILAADGRNALNGLGVAGYLRKSWTAHPLLLEVSIQYVPRNSDIVFGPCPPPACVSSFLGPSSVLTFAPAIQATERVPVAAWLFRIGPSLHWLPNRDPASDPLALGLHAGVGLRMGRTESGFLLSADYYRVFRGRIAPNWFLPLTLGWQF